MLWEWIWFIGSLLVLITGYYAIKASTVNKIILFMIVDIAMGVLAIMAYHQNFKVMNNKKFLNLRINISAKI